MKANPPTTIAHEPTSPPPPLLPPRQNHNAKPVQKTIARAGNLANLLPTGTVLAFRTLAPLFSNNGTCKLSNKYLTAMLIAFCSIICFLSSFTDSFTDCDGKLYCGIATFDGLYIFNRDDQDRNVVRCGEEIQTEEDVNVSDVGSFDLSKLRIRLIDFVHALVSLLVFLVFAFCDSDLQRCFFPCGGADLDVLVMNLPMAVGVFSSFFFLIFPTTRRGIGYSDMQDGKFR